MKLSKKELEDMIVREIKDIIDEEALIDPINVNFTGTGTVSTATGKSIHHGSKKGHHKSSSYMAKPQLAKVAEYAAKLHDMICNGEQLDDWMESHIAQMADDISEVYHALSYHKKRNK